MAIDPSTLDPDEIRQIPVDRSKPYNGLSEEQVRAIGADPDFVEQARLEQNDWTAEKALEEDAMLVLTAQQAVEDGEISPAEVALGLAEFGHDRAHEAFLDQWRASAAADAAEEASWELPYLDAESYAAQHAARKARERAQLEQQRDEAKRQFEAAQLEAVIDSFNSFVNSTPGAFAMKPTIESKIIEKLQRSGVLPSTDTERDRLIESSLIELEVLGTAAEEIKQQVETEWRLLRKENGGRDGLITVADIAAAEAHYKRMRFDQLAEAKKIDAASFEPLPSAEEQSAALVERYRAKEEKSTEFHRQVERLKEPPKSNDRGDYTTHAKNQYREAMARAEASAAYGPDAQINTGYGPDAVKAASAKPGGYDPDGTWPDDLGPAL